MPVRGLGAAGACHNEAKDKPFTGGISLDYKTRSTLEPKHGFEFGVFVGAPFSLFTR